MGQYLPIIVLMVLAIIFGGLSSVASLLLAPRRPNTDNHEMNVLLLMNCAMPCADCSVNFCMPNDTKITTMTQRRIASRRRTPRRVRRC